VTGTEARSAVADPHSAELEALSGQTLATLSGAEAITRLERAICRSAVAREQAVAEGLALAGFRAASLTGSPALAGAGGIALSGASCVHHVQGVPVGGARGTFELAASSVQQALDHCLAAHLLSQRLGRPGLCSLAPSLSRSLTLVEVPDDALVGALLGSESGPAEPDAGPGRALELARWALRAVSERTGRPADLLDYQGDAGAEVVLVASGAEVAPARELARSLSAASVPAGALALSLLEPFPRGSLRDALARARTVFVVSERARRELLVARLRGAIPSGCALHPLPAVGIAELLERMKPQLPPHAAAAEPPTPTRTLPCRRLALAPAGPWAEQTAREIVTALGQLGPLKLAPRTRERTGTTLLAWESEALGAGGDLLLAADPGLLDPRRALSVVRPGGTLLVVSVAGSPQALARALPPEVRSAIRERELRLHWVTVPDAESEASREPHGGAAFLVGAALAALVGSESPGAADAVARRLERGGQAAVARRLRAGAAGLQRVDPAALDPEHHREELDFRPRPELPRMPASLDDENERRSWARRIQRFHLAGAAQEPAPLATLRPAALASLAESLGGNASQPFVLVASGRTEQPLAVRRLAELLSEAIGTLQREGRSLRSLADNLERLVTLSAQQLAEGPGAVALHELLSSAGAHLLRELALPESEERVLGEDLAALCELVPGEAPVLDVRAETPLVLYRRVLEAVREPLHERFAAELERLREQLRDLLELDRMASERGRTPQALSAALGGSASDHLDPEALSRTLPDAAGSSVLDDERRDRIREALAILERHMDDRAELPRVILIEPPAAGPAEAEGVQRHPDPLAAAEGVQRHPDPLAAAIGVFDGTSRRMAALFRAVRTARLEVAGRYRPEIHDAALADLEWQALHADELALLPAVVVLSSGQRLRQRDQGSLSELLRSSRPVHVIVRDEVGAQDEAEDLSRFHVDLGYLVIAHREALAIATTLARPERLVEGLTRMVRAPRPGVVVVHLPALEPAPLRSLLAEAALQGRACLDIRYEPDAGSSWADRFDLAGNPEPERPWPIHAIRYLDGDTERSLELALTFADAVAFEPAYRGNFRVIPRAAWNEDQLPLAEYLERFDPEAPEPAVPFLWLIGEDETLQRAIVTRELALASRDRLRGWRVLQELAGHANVFAERAAEAARSQALDEADQRTAELARAHAEELERARGDAARESMERLAAVLIRPDGLPQTVAAPPAPAPPTLPEPAAAEPAPPPEPEEEAAPSFDEPYIDAALCTSCNECTDLNPRLFRYNADKQAYIADASAGSFAELVKAAELCPARCIHPGKPREGEASATPALIERAAAFN